MKETIAQYMSHPVQSISCRQTLAVAHRTMRELGIRHLVVRRGHQLVGIVSQRDLHLIETLPDVDPEDTQVEEAMTPGVYLVAPTSPLEQVVEEMVRRRVGAAVVVENDEVTGVFTTVDALHALATVLREPLVRVALARSQIRVSPSETSGRAGHPLVP